MMYNIIWWVIACNKSAYYLQYRIFNSSITLLGCLILMQLATCLISSSVLKFMVRRNEVRGLSFPRPLVWFPIPLKTDISGWYNMVGCVGSSQLRGIVDFAKSEQTNSPEDWETMCIPIIWLMSLNAVDLPLAVSPVAVETGQDP